MNEPTTPTDTGVPRRRAVLIIFGTLLGLVSGFVALVVGFVANAFGRRLAERPWIRVGPAEDLSIETYQRIILSVERTHAWVEKTVPVTIFVKDVDPPANPIAFLDVCSHLGCAVKWQAADKQFACPCHGGKYDDTGQVIAGPPPRPLTSVETKVEEDVFFVRLPEAGRSA